MKQEQPTPVDGAPRWLRPFKHDEAGPFNRMVRDRLCRKLRTSRFLKLATVEYEDGTIEQVSIGSLRTAK